jgi:ribosomal-protein-alanine N-acetyltransferase
MSSRASPSETFRIVEAAAADAAGLAALHAEVLPPGWPAPELAASCGGAHRAILKAVDGARLCGFVIVQFAAGEAEILAIGVAEDRRGHGCASALLRGAIGFCRERSVSSIFLEVAESNAAARRLYEKFGFSVIARRENYYRSASSAPETAIIMRLEVKLPASAVDPG